MRLLETLRNDDPLLDQLQKPLSGRTRKLRELVEVSTMLTNGHSDILSEAMKRAVDTSWFDVDARLTCDRPLPNLIVSSLLGIYGKPWFVNPRHSDHVTYRAQQRRMYCDMLVITGTSTGVSVF